MDNYYEYEDDDDVMGIPPFVFGFILLITAKWGKFFKENPFFKKFQEVV